MAAESLLVDEQLPKMSNVHEILFWRADEREVVAGGVG